MRKKTIRCSHRTRGYGKLPEEAVFLDRPAPVKTQGPLKEMAMKGEIQEIQNQIEQRYEVLEKGKLGKIFTNDILEVKYEGAELDNELMKMQQFNAQ